MHDEQTTRTEHIESEERVPKATPLRVRTGARAGFVLGDGTKGRPNLGFRGDILTGQDI